MGGPAELADGLDPVDPPATLHHHLRITREAAGIARNIADDLGLGCGERLCLIEAMKTFNEIVAPRAGTVTAIFVEDGMPVEYGEALLVLE